MAISLLATTTPRPVTTAAWVALAPHEAVHGDWRLIQIAGDSIAAAPVSGPLSTVTRSLPHATPDTAIVLIAPLSRCIALSVDLPPLQGVKLQQALAGMLGDRLTGTNGTQHYAAAAIENGRIREAAACDAVWLMQSLEAVAAAGLRIDRVIPEASLLPKGSAWWGQLQAELSPSWLVRGTNGEAVRVTAAMLDAVLPAQEDALRKTWLWLADPACGTPPGVNADRCTALPMAALLRRAANVACDLRQFALAPPDRATQFMQRCTHLVQLRSGRFAAGALLALLLVNVLGINVYAIKLRRDINARHAEMERLVALALPGAPRLLEPAVQLEAAWQRAHRGATQSDTGILLSLFAQSGSAQALSALDVSERALRATYADGPALERSWTECQSTAMREPLQRAGVRCARDGERLLLDFVRNSAAAPPKG